jgi:glutamine cyclotransferase
MEERYTSAEFTAYQVMRQCEGWGMCTDDKRTMHDAGNKIIELAERIKAERAVAAIRTIESVR